MREFVFGESVLNLLKRGSSLHLLSCTMSKRPATRKKKGEEEVEKTPQELCVENLENAVAADLTMHMCASLGFDKRLENRLGDEKTLKKIDEVEVESGNTALMLASKNGKLKCVEMLIEKGANANARGYYGLTALHLACRNDHLEVADFLLGKANADAKLPDEGGNLALHDAGRMGNIKSLELLLGKGGVDLESKNKAGSTAFMLAALNARGALLDILFKKQVAKNTANNKGNTALHMAASAGLTRIVRQLLENKCDHNLLNLENKTAEELCVIAACKKLFEGLA